jgi:nitroreductase
MEFNAVVRHRRMVRTYDLTRPVPTDVVARVVDTMLRAPSAGFSQGTGFLVLDTPEDVARFRASATPEKDVENWFAANVQAPVLIIPLANKDAYLSRYALPDKGFTDRSDEWWTSPYWDIDAGMAALLGLLSCVDQGLGACFFGMEISCVEPFKRDFEIPPEFRPIGIISLGYSSEPPRDLSKSRKPKDALVSYGRWGRVAPKLR